MNGRNIIALFVVLCFVGLASSCSDSLDTKRIYGFDLQTMPVPKSVTQGETIEIRCELLKEGRYDDAHYTIRYFQPDGDGALRLEDGLPFVPNDRYPLYQDSFRLYYTSESSERQTIDIYIEDNFGQVVQKSFGFNSNREPDEE